MKHWFLVPIFVLVFFASASCADHKVVTVYRIDREGVGEPIGNVTLTPTDYGVLLTPDLRGLSPGIHGFHVHENGSCEPAEKDGLQVAGLAAGGHYDPEKTLRHAGPYGDGHLGDLPALTADSDGRATLPLLAPRLRLQDFSSRALVIHSGGDNYADTPSPLGGGGTRIACGIIP
jgi:Cu-Zn family superoxide dismutase